MRPLPDIDGQLGVFSASQGHLSGWTTPALKHAVAIGRVWRPRHGIYAPVDGASEDPFADRLSRARQDSVAAVLAIRCSALSHRSAALFHGLPSLAVHHPCLTVHEATGRRPPRVQLHRAGLPAWHLSGSGWAMTTAARTIVDLAREHGFDEAVVAGDAALRLGLISPVDLEPVLDYCHGWPGTRAARAAADFLDGRSESPLESLSRIRIRDHGLPKPLLQASVRDEHGEFVARTDFLFDELGVIGEADGLGKYDTIGVEEHEQRRRQRLENLGFAFVRWQYRDLSRFEVIAERIWYAARHRSGPIRGYVVPADHPVRRNHPRNSDG